MNIQKMIAFCALACLMGCDSDAPDFEEAASRLTSRVVTPRVETARVDSNGRVSHQRPHLMDAHGRYVQIKGINVSGSHKAPPTEVHIPLNVAQTGEPVGQRSRPSRYPIVDRDREACLTQMPIPADCLEQGEDGVPCTETDTCSVDYIASPFPLSDADRWFGELAALGFNSVRLITNWESIQPYKPNSDICLGSDRYTDECYDLDYLAYYEALIAKAKAHGIYVLVDMHQDIFSRHIMTYYNESPSFLDGGETVQPPAGSLDHTILSLFPPFTDWVRGHGAPRWVVQTALPEKRMDSPYWGMFRGIGGLTTRDGGLNLGLLGTLQSLLNRFNPGGEIPAWLPDVLNSAPERRFEVNETSDILPLTPWIVPGLLSLDVDRSFAALFAGDKAFPNLVVDDDGFTKRRDEAANADAPGLQTYLQAHYAGAFRELAKRAKKYDNVIGYDVINEPVGVFLMMSLGGLFKQLVGPPSECVAPVDCLLPDGCQPDGDDWPNCLPAELVEDGENADDAYARLAGEAGTQFECIDDRGRDGVDGDVGDVRWCRSLSDRPATENPLVLYGDRFEDAIVSMLGVELGGELFGLIRGLQLLPTDAHPYTMYQWGLDEVDVGTALGMNFGFEQNHLQPFFENIGQAIQEEDPNAIIWFEPATSIRMITGPMQFWDQPLTRPKGIKQLVYAPHWYPDIYPQLGINSRPRQFNSDEWLYRDFTESLRHHMEESPTWLGNIPVVFGEFGTYFNLRLRQPDLRPAEATDISAHILNSYYEAFEELGVGNMVWCFSATNDALYGEDWNHEDFSIIGPDQEPRGWPAYVRTYARSTSGKLIRQRFVSQYHFWDPVQGEPRPSGDFDLHMQRRESDAATEIFVPRLQYPDGFYVWLSDGVAYYDDQRQMLYWYPSDDAPHTEHRLHLQPKSQVREAIGWTYYFEGEQVLFGSAPHAFAMEVE
ncbi:MAG: cellulase family glycosylhydrolase [Bradymonadia bacterium]